MTESAMQETAEFQTAPEMPLSERRLRDVLLAALTVASGALDAISYFGLGKLFSAFMTGNIVFLGFGLANLGGPAVVPVVVALSAFAVGGYLAARIVTLRSRPHVSWPRPVTVSLAFVAVAEAGFLVLWFAVGGHPSADTADVAIAVLSLAMGIQTAAIRSLGVLGVFTTALTFTLVALAGTVAATRSWAELSRLVGVVLGLVAGAVGGGLLFLHARSCAPALPLVITVGVIVTGWIVERRSRVRSASYS